MPKKSEAIETTTKIAKTEAPGAIVRWDQELAKYAEKVSANEITPSGSFISVRSGQLSFAGQPIAGNKMDVIVLDALMENAYYKGDFDPDNPQPPSCYAFGREEKDMRPHPEATEPQSETCATCPHNQWGSAERGKGKACKNLRRLAVLSTNGLDPANVGEVEEAYMKVSVTSVKGWALYVKGLNATYKRPPFAMVTKIGVVPDPKSQHRITFEPMGPVDDKLMPGILKRYMEHTEANKTAFPYPKGVVQEEKEKPAKSKVRKF